MAAVGGVGPAVVHVQAVRQRVGQTVQSVDEENAQANAPSRPSETNGSKRDRTARAARHRTVVVMGITSEEWEPYRHGKGLVRCCATPPP
jgi:hypothetical protein